MEPRFVAGFPQGPLRKQWCIERSIAGVEKQVRGHCQRAETQLVQAVPGIPVSSRATTQSF